MRGEFPSEGDLKQAAVVMQIESAEMYAEARRLFTAGNKSTVLCLQSAAAEASRISRIQMRIESA